VRLPAFFGGFLPDVFFLVAKIDCLSGLACIDLVMSPSVENPSGGASVAYFVLFFILPTEVLRKHPSTGIR
jgi:hypothetical protein